MARLITNDHAVEEFVAVQDIAIGTYVKREKDSAKVYERGEYDRNTKSYLLVDCNDHNRFVSVKRHKMLYVGFTY